MRVNKKVVVLGFDGATWAILKLLADRNIMPNLASLMKLGAWGNLASTLPMVTAASWATFATGKNPGSHGSFAFMVPDKDLVNTQPMTSNDIHATTFYEMLERKNKKSVIVNLPGSFPPRIKKGTLFPSFIDISADGAYPKSIYNTVPEAKEYMTSAPLYKNFSSESELMRSQRTVARSRFTAGKALFTKTTWDFFFLMFSETDWLQHDHAEQALMKDYPLNSEVFNLYRDLDSYLGWFVSHLPEDALFLLVSDHGFETANYWMNMNTWLEKRDLLHTVKRTKESKTSVPHGLLLLTQSKSRHPLDIMLRHIALFMLHHPGFYTMTVSIIRMLARIAPKQFGEVPGTDSLGVEMAGNKTLACIPVGVLDCIYLNRKDRFKNGVLNQKDAHHVQEEIIHGLSRLRGPDGKLAFKSIWKGSELYSGQQSAFAPDIVLEPTHLYLTSKLGKPEIFEKCKYGTGCHNREGIFLAYGKQVKVQGRIHDADLRDIAPTILEALGIRAPSDMEGRVLPAVYTKKHEPLIGKIQKAKELIFKVISSYPKNSVHLTWTGGKDSTVLLWLVREVCREKNMPMIPVFCIDEGDMFEEVKEFISLYVKRWKLSFTMVSNTDVLKQAKKIGDLVVLRKLNAVNQRAAKAVKFNGFSFPFEPESLVGNHLMKTVPLLSHIEKQKIQAVFVGIRRDEHDARKDETEISKRHNPDHVRVHPILEFTEEDIWDVIRLYNIPYNKLYEQGFRSLGVKSTTQKASSQPAWLQKSQGIRERQGRRQDKEGLMRQLRTLGYM